MKEILITPRGYANFKESYQEAFIKRGYTLNINTTGKQYDRDTFARYARRATAIIVGVEELDEPLLVTCEDLKVIVKFGVGTDNIDLGAAERLGIKVGRCVGSNSNAVAETALTLMMMCAKQILPSIFSVRSGGWEKLSGFELNGKTIGIIGFGHIGQIVAKLAGAFEMNILVYDTFPISKSVIEETRAVPSSLHEIYRSADFITLHLPLNNETRDMISEPEFDMMKPNACLVNTARGGIVNEEALYHALSDRKIFAAGFDVFTSEPPEDSEWVQKLVHLNNFVLTSHIAARTEEAERNTARIATEKTIELLEQGGE